MHHGEEEPWQCKLWSSNDALCVLVSDVPLCNDDDAASIQKWKGKEEDCQAKEGTASAAFPVFCTGPRPSAFGLESRTRSCGTSILGSLPSEAGILLCACVIAEDWDLLTNQRQLTLIIGFMFVNRSCSCQDLCIKGVSDRAALHCHGGEFSSI